MSRIRTIEEINEKIANGNAVVLTAEEIIDEVAQEGAEATLEKVDVVTTATFGPMCSSGAFLNFGHSDPPIRMAKTALNDVEAYSGIAAVDAYIGATQLSETEGDRYGGAHVICDLISRKPVRLSASSPGTDCYPRKRLRRRSLWTRSTKPICSTRETPTKTTERRSTFQAIRNTPTWELCDPTGRMSRTRRADSSARYSTTPTTERSG